MKNSETKSDELEDLFGPVIFTYTRTQAIEDGVLVDVTVLANQAGIILPTAISAAVFHRYVAVPEELKHSQDETGRLWDLVWMLYCAIRTGKVKGDTGTYKLIVRIPENEEWLSNEESHDGEPEPRLVTLKTVCGPGDDGAPCITVMRPDED